MKSLQTKAAVPIHRLTARADFLRVKELGSRGSQPTLVVQALKVPSQPGIALGFTATTKTVGNAVQRNRARRRLKAVVDAAIRLNPVWSTAGWWLVIIARPESLTVPLEDLHAHFAKALQKAGVTA